MAGQLYVILDLHRIHLAHFADQEDPVHFLRLGFRRRRQTLVEKKGTTRFVMSNMMVAISDLIWRR